MDDRISRLGPGSGVPGPLSAPESPASMEFQPEPERGSRILPGDSGAAAQALCRECGFCCDGTLFAYAVIAADENLDRLREIGIGTISDDGKSFTLPCSAFEQVCTIYRSGRPRVCGSFRCVLLKRHDRGEVSLESAREVVREARTHREKVDAELSAACGTPGGSLVQRFETLWRSRAERPGRERAAAMVNFVALGFRLDRDLRKGRPRAATAEADVSSGADLDGRGGAGRDGH